MTILYFIRHKKIPEYRYVGIAAKFSISKILSGLYECHSKLGVYILKDVVDLWELRTIFTYDDNVDRQIIERHKNIAIDVLGTFRGGGLNFNTNVANVIDGENKELINKILEVDPLFQRRRLIMREYFNQYVKNFYPEYDINAYKL